jgi:hypothetical protein
VRQFLSSAANHEIAKSEVSCIPYGISHKTLDRDCIPLRNEKLSAIQNKYLKQLQRKNSCNSGQNLTVETIDKIKWSLVSMTVLVELIRKP